MSKVTVIGAGNSGQAIAADAKLGGHEVCLFEFDAFTAGKALPRQIELWGPERNALGFKRNGLARMDLVTTQMAEAIRGAKYICLATRANYYEEACRAMVPFLEDDQVISLMPDNYGSLILRRVMREMGCDKSVLIGGWSSLPYGARITQAGECSRVYLMYRAVSLRFDTLPSCDAPAYLEAIRDFAPLNTVTPDQGDTVLDVGFSNVNPILHVPATVFNAGAIDNWGIIDEVGDRDVYFDIYRHGFSPHVAEIQWAVYQEEARIAQATGTGITPYDKSVFLSRTSILGPEFMGEGYVLPLDQSIPREDWMLYLPGERFTMESRYITEDIPVGLNIYFQLAEKYGVEVPTIRSIIQVVSMMMGVDYFKEGFSLDFLGIGQLDKEELLAYLTEGRDVSGKLR